MKLFQWNRSFAVTLKLFHLCHNIHLTENNFWQKTFALLLHLFNTGKTLANDNVLVHLSKNKNVLLNFMVDFLSWIQDFVYGACYLRTLFATFPYGMNSLLRAVAIPLIYFSASDGIGCPLCFGQILWSLTNWKKRNSLQREVIKRKENYFKWWWWGKGREKGKKFLLTYSYCHCPRTWFH